MGACSSSITARSQPICSDGAPPIFRVLILGSGESGKSTITKQIHRAQNGPQLVQYEKEQTQVALCFVGSVGSVALSSPYQFVKNALECLRAIVKAMQNFDLKPDPKFAEMVRLAIVEQDDKTQPVLTDALVQAAINFVTSERVKNFIVSHRNHFWILDAHPYYFSHLSRIAPRPYEYAEEDFIFARVKTSGVVQTVIQIPNSFNSAIRHRSISFEMIDVAGQRSERRKWIQYFDNVDAITFVVNLAGYATPMLEDNQTLRMHDELTLFEQVVGNVIFKDIHIFLVLNKKDIFEELLRQIPLTTCFPEYDGPVNDVGEALSFVSRKFKSIMPGGQTKRLSVFFMSARVRREVKCAFDDIFKHIFVHGKHRLQ